MGMICGPHVQKLGLVRLTPRRGLIIQMPKQRRPQRNSSGITALSSRYKCLLLFAITTDEAAHYNGTFLLIIETATSN